MVLTCSAEFAWWGRMSPLLARGLSQESILEKTEEDAVSERIKNKGYVDWHLRKNRLE